MELTPQLVQDHEGFEAFRALLQSSNLPHADLNYKDHILVGYYENNELIGTGGLEVYDGYALLRSLAVKMGVRGLSIGSFITKDLIEQARKKKLKGIYLLTETAHGFFQLKGFKDVDRTSVPEAVKSSTEFSHVCPTSAACMFLDLS
ncbi:MAG TPA: arsenic resistance N-acetyltransferase ArsN2 [Cyclobacteriaceae bacterium]|jgi:amino-acid N-acetyltransferase|nr:arsenic resistance N-acetyltransferase ArsN2 [Cyclobacteriaceae bacterium]